MVEELDKKIYYSCTRVIYILILCRSKWSWLPQRSLSVHSLICPTLKTLVQIMHHYCLSVGPLRMGRNYGISPANYYNTTFWINLEGDNHPTTLRLFQPKTSYQLSYYRAFIIVSDMKVWLLWGIICHLLIVECHYLPLIRTDHPHLGLLSLIFMIFWIKIRVSGSYLM